MFVTKSQLSEGSFQPFRDHQNGVELARIETLVVRPGGYYIVAKRKRWQSANYVKVISVEALGAVCEIAKVDGRLKYGNVTWLPSKEFIPFTAFL